MDAPLAPAKRPANKSLRTKILNLLFMTMGLPVIFQQLHATAGLIYRDG